MRMTYGTKEGAAYASDGAEVQDMSGQAFFQAAIEAAAWSATPSSQMDGTDLIVLAVPSL